MVCWRRDFVCLPIVPIICKNSNISSFFSRFKGTSCSLDAVTKTKECFCCSEIDRCQGKLEAVTDDGELPPICQGFNLVV